MKLWQAIENFSIDDSVDEAERKHIRVLNVLSFVVAVQLVPACLLWIYYGSTTRELLWFSLGDLALQFVVFFCNYRRWRLAARLVFAFSGFKTILAGSVHLGVASHFHYMLVAIIVAGFSFFAARDRVYMLASAALAVLFIVGLEYLELPPLAEPGPELLKTIRVFVAIWTPGLILGFALFGRFGYDKAEADLAVERRKSDALLRNVLPEAIAERLKAQETMIADGFDAVTVLFADIVGFTELSGRLPPAKVVGLLDRIFSEFDELARRHGLEKIKTIGDAYMVVGGVPVAVNDSRRPVLAMALDMRDLMRDSFAAAGEGTELRLRIGIHCGPAVAGIIGKQKFAYDLWGDSVNTASRMESHGIPGQIQVTGEVMRGLETEFEFEARGEIEVKGKGRMPVWLLAGKRQAKATP